MRNEYLGALLIVVGILGIFGSIGGLIIYLSSRR